MSKQLNNSNKAFLLVALLCNFFIGFSKSSATHFFSYFTENKGQVGDQYYKARPDILFAGTEGALSFHLRKTGVSYQQYRVDKWDEVEHPLTGKKIKEASETTIYRVDMDWLNSNTDPKVEKRFPMNGFSNFYLPSCPDGATEVRTYQEVLYKEIYKGIDVRWYRKNGQLKYDYLVAAGADHKNIQIEIKGATLSINSLGELIIETPLGKIIEEAPYVTQNGKVLKSKWVIQNNIVSFQIEKVDPNSPLVIDPGVRIWGTYYGGNGGDSSLNNAVDANGNVWIGGTTSSTNGTSIATVGSHQSVYGGGADNAYIAKFDASGTRLWATYYGGTVREFGFNIAIDSNGNSYLCGQSLGSSGTTIATIGSHQPTFAGTADAWVVKFNSNGIRQWGTFYGDTGLEAGYGVAADASGNVYLVGKTDAPTTNVISTSGVHQQNFGGVEDGFIVKFNSAGVRQWGTYYGGTGTDVARNVHVDAAGNIYVVGWTDNSVPNVIGTAGAHQNVYGGGGYDAYIVKFNPAGVRQWGTHFGGNGEDLAYDCETDLLGNVYMSGKTASTNSISTVGSHQIVYGGGNLDAFLVSFNSTTGVRNWATYYGGTGDEESWGCSVHKSGHIMMTGHTQSTTGTVIATPGSHKPTYGGGTWDAFMAQFDPSTNGTRTWGSYFGGSDDDVGYGCSSDNAYHFYMTGSTFSNPGNDIATVGSHQPNYGGGFFGDAYLQKFYDCPAPLAPTNTTLPANQTLCEINTTTLSAISGATMSWYSSPTSTTSLGSGSVYVTPPLSAGVYTYYVDAATCTTSPRTPITITVNPQPNLNIIASPSVVCAGKSSTLFVSGAPSILWDNSATTQTNAVTPTISTTYSVTGTSSLGCSSTSVITVNVYTLDVLVFTPATDTACLHITGGTPVLLTANPSGGVFSGANVNGNYLNPTALGIFNPVYTYTNPSNGCVSSTTASILVVDCTGLDEINLSHHPIEVYPNPTDGQLLINTNTNKEKTITITDARGRVIYTVTSNDTVFGINLSMHANGIYILKIQDHLGSNHFKIVKE